MRTETITFNNQPFAVRLLDSEELLDALQVKDNDGTDLDFISQDAIDIYDEIFFFADSQTTLTIEDDELIKKLIGDNPDFIEWIG